MEAERPQEEEGGEQGPPQDEHGWPPVNTTIRPWRSAPPSPPPGTRHTALGPRSASLLSLQTELLLDLVAEAQSRRLEEQRATFHVPQGPPNLAPAPPRPQEDKEQLYSTILSHQCQRMEAQRSEPPLPPGGQELLELLLRVQGAPELDAADISLSIALAHVPGNRGGDGLAPGDSQGAAVGTPRRPAARQDPRPPPPKKTPRPPRLRPGGRPALLANERG